MIAAVFVICVAQFSYVYATAATCPPETATLCEDGTKKMCEILFPGSTGALSPNCQNDSYADFIDECLQTCELCCNDPRYSCSDSGIDAVNCTTIREMNMCDEPTMQDVIIQYCQGTCGKCAEDSNPSCVDEDVAYCTAFSFGCLQSSVKETVQKRCPKTCGTCDKIATAGVTTANTAAGIVTTTTVAAATCTDVAYDCVEKSYLCTNSVYLSLMRTQCPKTCNFC